MVGWGHTLSTHASFRVFFLSILLYLQNKVIVTNITNTPPGFQAYLMNGPYGELFSNFFIKALEILLNKVLIENNYAAGRCRTWFYLFKNK